AYIGTHCAASFLPSEAVPANHGGKAHRYYALEGHVSWFGGWGRKADRRHMGKSFSDSDIDPSLGMSVVETNTNMLRARVFNNSST
ncbi:hypothetical protein COCCADRAFT_83529, partial [Bipolaris zeicola 26-R-13]